MTPEEIAAKIKAINGSKRRAFLGGAVKGIDAEKRTIRAYASTTDWDRYGERFEADAFTAGLANFQKNPVVLFAHDYTQAPIGKAIAYEFDAKGLILTMQFAETEKANEVFELYKGGFMNAFSVGFKPIETAYEERSAGGEMGLVYKRAELLENSAVPVPANPGAVVIKGAAGASREISGEMLGDLLIASFRSPALHEPAAVPPSTEAASPSPEPKTKGAAVEGAAPDLGESLEYLISLGKILKHKGKVGDERLRGLLIQANNLCRELVYGPGAAHLEDAGQDMTEEQQVALVREYESLSEVIKKGVGVTDEDRAEFEKLGGMIDKLISGN